MMYLVVLASERLHRYRFLLNTMLVCMTCCHANAIPCACNAAMLYATIDAFACADGKANPSR